MSGGHYLDGRGRYLCFADADALVVDTQGIEEMAADLAALGYAEDAAAETEEIALIIKQFRVRINTRLERIQPIWRAMDWWKSCDSSEQEVSKALSTYRGENE